MNLNENGNKYTLSYKSNLKQRRPIFVALPARAWTRLALDTSIAAVARGFFYLSIVSVVSELLKLIIFKI